MKYLFGILLALTLITVKGQDTVKVLFIGNSFTYFNDMPMMFDSIARSAGYKVKTQMYAPGGVSVGDTSQGTMAHMNNPVVYENIRSDHWDYVVLQDNQGRFVLDYGVFPSSSLVIQGHLQIRDSVVKNNPCAKMVWFTGWGMKNGLPPNGNTGIEMIERIAANYRYLNDTAHQIIAPIGGTWKKIILMNPAFDLWSPDQTHPSVEGSFLTASLLYATIFRDFPQNSPFNSSLTTSTTSLLKQAAWETLNDSFPITNLASITPALVFQNNQLVSNIYSQYNWYQNLQYLQGENSNILPVSSTGYYFLMASDTYGCKLKSLTQQINFQSQEEVTQQNNMMLFPNPASNELNVTFNFPVSEKMQFEVMDFSGKIVKKGKATLSQLNSQLLKINIALLPSGFYVFSVDSSKSIKFQIIR